MFDALAKSASSLDELTKMANILKQKNHGNLKSSEYNKNTIFKPAFLSVFEFQEGKTRQSYFYHTHLRDAFVVIGSLGALAARLLHGGASLIAVVTLAPPRLVDDTLRRQVDLRWDRMRDNNVRW